MDLLREKHSDLQDCDGSIKFCRRVKGLIKAIMNSRTHLNTLRPHNDM